MPQIPRRLRYAWGQVRRRVSVPVTITDPPAGILFERDVEVPMRDGVVLRVNVFRPQDGGRHPVILSAHPYGKDALPKPRRSARGYRAPVQYHMMQTGPVTHSAWTSWEAPDPAHWVPRGYVVVNADLRGWGHSDGVGYPLTEQEGRDGHDLVEWAAAQPWSTGRVGMSGVSYLALSQWAAASERPPHLSAIVPWEGFTDLYRDWARPGGVRENGFFTMWTAGLRIGTGRKVDFGAQARRRPEFDDWWAARNRSVDAIDAPALICGSFSDQNLHSRGSFEGFRRIASQHKWLYTHRDPKWSAYYSSDGLAAQERFLDHFLRGADTGILQRPSVRVEVREDRTTVTSVREVADWPPPDTAWRTVYLRAGVGAADGTLEVDPPTAAASTSFRIRRGRASFTHRFERDTEIVGPMVVRVTLSVTGADDVSVFAGVRKFRNGREVTFHGSYGFPGDLVTHGMLLASHRRVDPERSLPHRPYHPHIARQPLTAGEPVELDLELISSATLFRAGEELRLDLQGRWLFSRNPLVGQFPPAYAAVGRGGTCTIHTGGTHRGSLLLPVAPDAGGPQR